MKNEDEKDGLDFEFDESLEDDINDEDGDSNSDDELIDLLDIVEEGEVLDDSEPDGLIDFQGIVEEGEALDDAEPDELIDFQGIVEEEEALDKSEPGEIELLDEEGPVQKGSGLENELSSSLLDGIDQVLGDDTPQALELDDELNIENSEPAEEIISPEPENMELSEEGSEDMHLGDTLEFSRDDLTEELSSEELFGISEEKLEAIITKAVQDSVERVARETMAGVAEKVIRESIEALKQSLDVRVESTPE